MRDLLLLQGDGSDSRSSEHPGMSDSRLSKDFGLDQHLLCIFTSSESSPLATFEPQQLQPTWFENARIVEEALESDANGYIVLSGSSKEISGKICRMQSTAKNTAYEEDEIEIIVR